MVLSTPEWNPSPQSSCILVGWPVARSVAASGGSAPSPSSISRCRRIAARRAKSETALLAPDRSHLSYSLLAGQNHRNRRVGSTRFYRGPGQKGLQREKLDSNRERKKKDLK
eukprot:scaffold262851_cov30-Tisochrysis_lutea.AAC.4